jgi:uncharacterized lipoprotein YmbA
MKNAAALAAGIALLAGCVSFQDVPPREYYVLDDLARAGASRPAAPAGRVLLVNPASTSPFYDTQNMVFSRSPGQRAYYQFAGWTERPGRRLSELLMRRLEARGSFKSVAATTAGIKGDLVLTTRLEVLSRFRRSRQRRMSRGTGRSPGFDRRTTQVRAERAGRRRNAQAAVLFPRLNRSLDRNVGLDQAMAQPVAR